MLTDKELKAIEEKQAAREHCRKHRYHDDPESCPTKDYDEQWSCIVHLDTDELTDESASLLSEVKRLRAENQSYGRTIVALSSGWQSVADGAKPGPEDWYVVAIVSRERNFDGRPDGEIRQGYTVIGDEIIELYGRARHPGTEFPREGTHFLVIPAPPFPPPPIRRET